MSPPMASRQVMPVDDNDVCIGLEALLQDFDDHRIDGYQSS